MSSNMLMESNDVASTLFEQAPVAMLLIDGAGYIQSLNAAAVLLFGYAKSVLVGHPVEVLVPEAARQKHLRIREEFFGSPKARPMSEGRRLSGRRKDGHEIPISVGLNPVRFGGNPVIVIVSILGAPIADALEKERG